MIELAVVCRRCGREYEPDPVDLRRGRWKVCVDCRPRGKDPPRRRPLDDPNPPRVTEPDRAHVKGCTE